MANDRLDPIWELDSLKHIKKEIESEGLILEAIENFEPADWHDILLDGPKKYEQAERIKTIIRHLGKVGIPIMGYNFSIAGVASRVSGAYARGRAESVGMEGEDQTPIPNGMVWNMVYNQEAPTGEIATFSHEELWQRLAWFLDEIVPVAEEAGVRMAAHPDDPPMPFVRNTPRLVYQPHLYQKLLDLHPSPSNALEYCLGSLAEMTEGDVYEATEKYAGQGAIGYVHFRNVTDKVPFYKETFIDEGEIDMRRILAILKRNKFDGVLIPDHTPLMNCDAPWHAGMAYAMGYMRALLKDFDNN
jgi:mannonate dehydratase